MEYPVPGTLSGATTHLSNALRGILAKAHPGPTWNITKQVNEDGKLFKSMKIQKIFYFYFLSNVIFLI